jgi:hypothetical protein
MKWEVIKNMPESDFFRAFGVNFLVFRTLVDVLEDEFRQRKYSGRPPLLSFDDQVLMTLLHLKTYLTLQVLGLIFGVSETTAFNIVTKTVEKLYNNDDFNLIAKNSHRLTDPPAENSHGNDKSENEIEEPVELIEPPTSPDQHRLYLVDVTEVLRERPIVNQSEHYSGKVEDFTEKAQIIIDYLTGEIVHLAFGKGRMHDFNLFKNSTKHFDPSCHFIADSGYQGIEKIFENSFSPFKSCGNEPLSEFKKQVNKCIAKMRIKVEHTIREIKKFRMFSNRYRGKGKNFAMRFSLVAQLYNMRIG